MREIKFRGQTMKGEWVYGLLCKPLEGENKGKTFISNKAGMPMAYEVIHETVGQYTGLKDKNGKEIYVGDILAFPYITPFGEIGDSPNEFSYTGEVCFDKGCFCLTPIIYEGIALYHEINPLYKWLKTRVGKYIPNYGNKTIYKEMVCYIIGNKFENSELLN